MSSFWCSTVLAQSSRKAPPPPPPPPQDFLSSLAEEEPGKIEGVKLEVEIVDSGQASEQLEQLKERVTQYWLYNLDDDFYAMYEMLLPESRKDRTFKDFTKLTRANITNFAMQKVAVWGDQCAAVVTKGKIKSEHMDLDGVSLRQRWVLHEGEWYLYMRSPKDYIPMFGLRNSAKKGPCPLPDALKPKMAEKQTSVRHSL
jgi:hypothetical protein